MNVWVLSHLRESIGTRITTQLFETCGHTVHHVDPDSIHLGLNARAEAPLEILGAELAAPDLIYTRLGSSAPRRAIDVVRHLEARYPCVNSSKSLEIARDKFRSYQCLAAEGLPVPRSVLVSKDVALNSVKDYLGDAPWVIKIPQSTKGAGVCIAESPRSLKSVVGTLLSVHDRILVQEYIESGGSDIRVMVFGGEASVAVRRSSGSPDEFRSNVALGGLDTAVESNDSMQGIAVRAANSHGLAVAGIDLLESNGDYYIAEVNGSPGLYGPHRRYGAELERDFSKFIASFDPESS